ncbi:MAG: hypothetical protein ACI85I_002843, partial [Arenicella sp.]
SSGHSKYEKVIEKQGCKAMRLKMGKRFSMFHSTTSALNSTAIKP